MEKDLILYNDDKNSFNHVRACLIRFCNHSPLQAEQCVIIAHNVGKVQVKRGDIMEMLEIQRELQSKNLIVDLENVCYQ